jgi:hypothetical protein
MRAGVTLARIITHAKALLSRRAPLALAALGAALGASGPAEAQFFERAFPGARSGEITCYARTYDAAHLTANARQRVVFVALKMEPRKSDEKAQQANDFELLVGLRVRSRGGFYIKRAFCKAGAEAARCGLESDGGDIRIQTAANGGLRVDTSGGEIRIEGDRDAIEVGGKLSDDNVFRLDRAPAQACASLR